MRFPTVWHALAIAIPAASATIGTGFYVATFFGYGWPVGKVSLAVAWCALYIPWFPRLLMDRQFFLQHWGFGISALTQHFGYQPFPARRQRWLNPFGRALFALLIIHFVINFAGIVQHVRPDVYARGILRLLSLAVVAGGICTALQWIYPPTVLPDGTTVLPDGKTNGIS
jgi:hypothetical protein